MSNLVIKYVRWHCMVHLASFSVPSLTVSYESLLEEPETELTRVVKWLGFDAHQSKIKAAISRNPAKYSPPLQEGLPSKWTQSFAKDGSWRPVSQAFVDEWAKVSEALRASSEQSMGTEGVEFEQVCGPVSRGGAFQLRRRL